MNANDNNRKFKQETFLSVKLSFQIIMFVFSVVVFLSLVTGGTLFGAAGRAINAFILGVFGHGAYPLFLFVIYFAVKLFTGKKPTASKKTAVCLVLLFLCAVSMYHLITSNGLIEISQSYSEYLSKCFEAGSNGIGGATGGGLLFGLALYPFKALFEATGTYIILSLIFIITMLILFGRSRKTLEEKEYPAQFFAQQPVPEQQDEKKEFKLPEYYKTESIPEAHTVKINTERSVPTNEEDADGIVAVPKKLFVGFIEDFVSTKGKKNKQFNKSFDILYSNKNPDNRQVPYNEEPKEKALGGSSYVNTFGDDIESKKKYILTPVDNILRPSADYGTGRLFPVNTNAEKESEPSEKPQRINHNMGGFNTPNERGGAAVNPYQKYANEYGDNLNIGVSPKKIEKMDYLDNLSGLMDKYSKTANEKPMFISDVADASESKKEEENRYKKEDDFFSSGVYQDKEENSFEDTDIQAKNPDMNSETHSRLSEVNSEMHSRLSEINSEMHSRLSETNSDPTTRFHETDVTINLPSIGKSAVKNDSPLKYQTEISVKKDVPIIRSPYVSPNVSLMNDILFSPSDVTENYEEKVAVLESTLNEFKVPAKVVSVTPGPTVTRYELQMPPGVPVSRLTSRANDIAMCLASNGEIRIEAPIPGKSLLGIELPNKKRQKVGLKEVIDSQEFINNKSPVTFALGKEITGKNVIIDFSKMPHLLVAGSTGSGKSVCLNTLIISILYKASPEDVRLILIDPKRVEFNIYNGLPHLMLKDVITDAEKAISAFNWAINEMDRRFELFKESVSKDIIAYNEKMKQSGGQKLPRILIIVDELAELMMINKRELEDKIKKISQLSRAAGIHLILATQRPSVDIITGVIKANLSSRVTFKLMTQADSRTVLDCSGAEKLLGNGDMIFLSNTMPKPVRLQGPFISAEEVEAIVDFIKKNNEAYYDEDVEQKIMNPEVEREELDEDEEQSEEMDKYFVEALKLAIDSGQISISMVQRRFAVGYSRAGKIIDEMERQRFISAFEGSKPRQVLITKEEFERRFGTEG